MKEVPPMMIEKQRLLELISEIEVGYLNDTGTFDGIRMCIERDMLEHCVLRLFAFLYEQARSGIKERQIPWEDTLRIMSEVAKGNLTYPEKFSVQPAVTVIREKAAA